MRRLFVERRGTRRTIKNGGALESQAALAQSLRQAGCQDVRITAQSYVVHAKGPDGAPAVMMITPDSITGVEEQPQSAELPNPDQQNGQQNGARHDNGGTDQMPGTNGTRQQD